MEHIITTPEQLQILIGNTVEQSVRNALNTLPKPKDPEPKTEEKLLTTKDVCKLFSKLLSFFIDNYFQRKHFKIIKSLKQ